MKKSILALAMLSMAVATPLMSSCGGESSNTPIVPPTSGSNETSNPDVSIPDGPFKIIDVKGREVEFKKHAQKAICLGAGALRLYSYVGDMNKLCAVEDFDKPGEKPLSRPYQYVYKDVLNKLPSCGKGGPGKPSYDYELLASLKADVIFTCDKSDAAFLDSITQKTATPVCAIDYGKLNVFDTNTEGNAFRVSLKTIAAIMGTEQKYNDLTAFLDAKVGDLNNKTKDIADADKKSVYFGGVGKKMAKGLECSQQNHAMLNAINAKNILDGQEISISGQLQVDKEFLATINPDIVLIDFGGLADVKTQLATAGEKETYTGWDALKTADRTYVVLPYGDYNIQSECALINAMFAASVIFPEQYEGFDIAKAASEVFTTFYGVDKFNDFCADNNLTESVFKSHILVK